MSNSLAHKFKRINYCINSCESKLFLYGNEKMHFAFYFFISNSNTLFTFLVLTYSFVALVLSVYHRKGLNIVHIACAM